MIDESSQEICRQIVFLIDCNPSFWGPNNCAEDTTNAIRLCVLRVLTYFNDNGRGKRSNLRWGYKFFNSRSLSHQFERHEFKDFTVEVFEEFENQVSKKLNEAVAQQSQVNRFEQDEQNEEEASTFNKPPAGAKCISCAFTNAVHDFQWERPDISSPVRRTRGNNNLFGHGNRSKTRNVMFLLSACPCDDDSISDFTGETLSSLRTFDGVKNVLMPSVLYKEFKQRHICLHWINTRNAQQEKETTLKSSFDAFVEQLGGCMIPLSAVICGGNNSDLTNSSGRDISACIEVTSCSSRGLLLPLKTVLDFYFSGKTTKLTEVVNITQQQMKMGCNETTGYLCSSGTDEKVHCCVKLRSMFQPVAEQQDPTDHHHSTATEAIDTTTKVSASDEDKSSPNLLWIRGVISHTCVCPTWLHPTKGYSCIGVDDSCTAVSNSALCSQRFISGWFQELLLSLAKENKLLVLDFIDCDSGLPVSGVLQPLTSVCGVVSVIASDFLVVFEKLLLWNGKTSVLDRKNEKSVAETPHHLVNAHISKTASKPAGPLRYNEVFLGLTGKSKSDLEDPTTTDGRTFDAGFLDPWCSFPVVDHRNSLLPSELRRGIESEEEEDADSESEANLMKELKALYYSKETKPSSTALNKKQPPKQPKRKINTPKKAKVKKDSSKLSRTLNKKTETDDPNNQLDENGSQPAVNKNEIQDSCTTEEKEITTISTETRQVPCDIKDEAELVNVVQNLYNKVILEGANILQETNNIMTLVSRNYGKEGASREKDFVSAFLGEHLLLTISGLRGKYEGCSDIIRTGQQVREYQLQILLRMEIAVLTNTNENSSLAEEVTVLLRAISFMKDPEFLTVYLREVLLQRYSRSLSKLLCGVYEGLMMRPPKELLSPSKWSSDDESPIRRSVNSNLSVKQDSSQPRSSGCRVITRHLSITDGIGKRREIVVPGKAKPKEKEKKNKEKSQGPISSRGAEKVKKATGQKTPVKQVRRNLFTESEEGDENNSSARVPRKRKLSESGGNNEQAKRRWHRRNTVGSFSKSTVQETPTHKQVSHALWNKQDRARKRSRAYTEVHVLQESPLKELQAGEVLPRRSPRKPPAVTFQRSQSFYGRSASAGPLTRTRSFTRGYAHDFPKKGPTDRSDSIPSKETVIKKTPQKLFLATVSPLRFSPRQKKKKFSLHSLLTTAKECGQNEQSSPNRQRVTTPKEKLLVTRSSPRLLKKRSFSCIGFSSVPFPEVQDKKLDRLRAKSKSFEGTNHKSPLMEDVCSGDVFQESLTRTPKKENADKISEVRKITPKSTQAHPEKRTPLKDNRMDDCVVRLTPIRHHLKSPVQVSPKIITHRPSSCSKDLNQPGCTIESSTHSEKSASAPNANLGTPVKRDIIPAVRSSPRLPSKRDIPESSKETGESSYKSSNFKSKDEKKANSSSVISAKSSREDLTQSRTPVKDCPFDDCVVLLTPIRRPLTSPVHVRSQEKNPSTETFSVDAANSLLSKEVSNPTTSPRLSPCTAMPSALDALKERKLSKYFPMVNSESTGSSSKNEGTEWFNRVGTLMDKNDKCRDTSAAPEGHAPLIQGAVKSPPRLTRASTTAAQLLSNQRPQNFTPPPMKGKKKSHGLSNSPAETKRLSPLNQILRQQKRKRCVSSSPADKRSRERVEVRAHDTSCTPRRIPREETKKRKSTRGKDSDQLSVLNVSCPVVLEDNSRSSEDGDDWLREMEKEFDRSMAEKSEVTKSPPTKKRRIHKSVVFGGKGAEKESSKKRKNKSMNSSLSSDASYEEDDEVFQSPAALASSLCLRRRNLNKTPLSASSIQVLQESPILFDSKLSLPTSVRARICSDMSPNSEEYSRKGRLSRRKVVDESGDREASVTEALIDDQEEPIGAHLRKRLKLNT